MSELAGDPECCRNWLPISMICAGDRAAFAMRAESGRIPTRARTVVEYAWDKEQLARALEDIAATIGRYLQASRPATLQGVLYLGRILEPGYGKDLDEAFHDAIRAMLDREPTTVELRACDDIRKRLMVDVDLVRQVSSQRSIPAHKWAPELLDSFNWERSEHLWRMDPRNREGHRQGYDIEGIEFDSAAARSAGFSFGTPAHQPRARSAPVSHVESTAKRPPSPAAWNAWVARFKADNHPLPDVNRVIVGLAKASFPEHRITQAAVRQAFKGGRPGPRR